MKLRQGTRRDKTDVNAGPVGPEKPLVVGARVSEADYQELQAIRAERGDRRLSDTIRAALKEFRARHRNGRGPLGRWMDRITG